MQYLPTGRAWHVIRINKYDFFRAFIPGHLALAALQDFLFGDILHIDIRSFDDHGTSLGVDGENAGGGGGGYPPV